MTTRNNGCSGKTALRSDGRASAGMPRRLLDTPALVIDLPTLERNIRLMGRHAAACGKALRPHAKTHKCSRIARMQMEAGAVGLCVAKVSEAEVLLDNGVRQVLITSPVVTPRKIERLLACAARSPDVAVVLDDARNALELNRAARARGLRLAVLVDIDPGLGRTGVSFDRAVALCRRVARLDALDLRGIQCYAGHLQHVRSFRERRRKSLECMRRAAQVVRELRAAGLACALFTGAGTGTYDIDPLVPELTDLQVGSYALMDAEYLGIGSAQDARRFPVFKPALTLLTSVVSANRPGQVTVDAGLKALYHHGQTPRVLRPRGLGATYDWFGDEHGRIVLGPRARRLEPGAVVELIVSHCDPTVNLFDTLYVTRNGRVVDAWPVDMRGKSQ